MSVISGSHEPGFTLSIYRMLPGKGKFIYGEGNGKVFKTSDEASAWALSHGHTQIYYRRVWCLKHRCLHTFLGKPSPTHGECWRDEEN